MSKLTLEDWSSSAASNTDLGASLNTGGTGLVSTADDSFREIMAQVARWIIDIGASATVGGTANALTITVSQPFTAYGTSAGQIVNGTVITVKPVSANTGATTINVNSIGTKAIQLQGDSALSGGEMSANGTYLLRYDTAYNSAAGGWVLLNPQGVTSSSFSDSAFRVQDNGDATKQIALEASGITTGTTRTFTAPDNSGVLALDGAGITTIASATSTAIGASKTRDVIISGTTTITSFDTVAAGTVRNITFSGVLALTYSATALILPGTTTLTTAAGDNCVAESLGSGNWRILVYQKADGTAISAAAGGMTMLATQAINSSSVTVTGLSTSYNQFQLVITGLTCSGGGTTMTVNISSDNGSTFDTGFAISSFTAAAINEVITIYNVGNTGNKQVLLVPNGSPTSGQFTTKTSPTNAIRIAASGGTPNGGTMLIYGIK